MRRYPGPSQRTAAAAAIAALLAAACPSAASEAPLIVAAESPDSPSGRMAERIAASLSGGGVPATARSAPGVLGPVIAVRHSSVPMLALAPGALPAFFSSRLGRGAGDALSRLGAEMGLVTALDARPMHLLARERFRSIDDLGGARIGIGPLERPGALSALLLLDAASVSPGEIDTGPLESAIAGLQAGRLDALFIAATVPDLLIRRAIDRADGLSLLPIRLGTDLPGLEPTAIPGRAYGFNGTPVPTAALRMALVAYLYDGPSCDLIRAAADRLSAELPELSRTGGAAWATVEPGAETGYQPHPCAGLAADPVAGGAASPPRDRPDGITPEAEAAGRALGAAIDALLKGKGAE